MSDTDRASVARRVRKTYTDINGDLVRRVSNSVRETIHKPIFMAADTVSFAPVAISDTIFMEVDDD